MKIIGWDASTTTTAWAILDVNIDSGSISYVDSGYFKPQKTGTIFERLDHSRKEVKKILEIHKPDAAAIENIIEFMKGHSTAKTVIALSVFNRNIGMTLYDYLGKSPELYNVMSIRHALKLTKTLPKKQEMAGLVAHHLGITFPYAYGKKGKVLVENEDVADAIAVALYYAFVLTGKKKKK